MPARNAPTTFVTLLMLPMLALHRVIRRMEPIDAFKLSTVSKKVKKIAEEQSKKQKIKAKFTLNDDRFMFVVYKKLGYSPEFIVRGNQLRLSKHNRSITINEIEVPCYYDEEHRMVEIQTVWANTLDGLNAIITHISDIFKIDEACGTFTGIGGAEVNRILSFLKNDGITWEDVEIMPQNAETTDDDYRRILDICLPDVRVFQTRAEPRADFEYALEIIEKPNLKCVEIDFSRWINLQGLLSLTACQTICLKDSLISNEDLNVFLMNWKNGNWNIRSLTLHFNENRHLNLEIVTNGTGATRVIFDEDYHHELDEEFEEYVENPPVYDIVRHDGRRARVHGHHILEVFQMSIF